MSPRETSPPARPLARSRPASDSPTSRSPNCQSPAQPPAVRSDVPPSAGQNSTALHTTPARAAAPKPSANNLTAAPAHAATAEWRSDSAPESPDDSSAPAHNPE